MYWNVPIDSEVSITGHMPKSVVQLVNIYEVYHIIGRSKLNEKLPAMTTYEVLLDVSISSIYKKKQQISNFN